MSYEEFVTRQRGRAACVSYSCSCHRLRPLWELFFCTECERLVCDSPKCCQTTILTHYCPNCQKNPWSGAIIEYKNRCETCVDCPNCFAALQLISDATAPAARKLSWACDHCKWSSLNCGTPLVAADAATLLKELTDREKRRDADSKFGELSSAYKAANTVAITERKKKSNINHERKSVRVAKRSMLEHLPEVQAAIRKLDAQLSQRTRSAAEDKLDTTTNTGTTAATAATTAIVPLWRSDTAGVFNKVNGVTTLRQRLAHPDAQPTNPRELLPVRRALVTKLSYRCRTCEKNVLVPKAPGDKIDFAVHNVAVSFIPAVTISDHVPLRVDRSTTIILYFKNPTMSELRLSLGDPRDPVERSRIIAASSRRAPPSTPSRQRAAAAASIPTSDTTSSTGTSGSDTGLSISITQPMSPSVAMLEIKGDDDKKKDIPVYPSTAKLSFVSGEVPVSAYDDTESSPSRAGDSPETAGGIGSKDNPAIVAYRHLNRVGLKIDVTPTMTDKDVVFPLSVHVTGGNKTLGGFVSVSFTVMVNLGTATLSSSGGSTASLLSTPSRAT